MCVYMYMCIATHVYAFAHVCVYTCLCRYILMYLLWFCTKTMLCFLPGQKGFPGLQGIKGDQGDQGFPGSKGRCFIGGYLTDLIELTALGYLVLPM